AERVADPSEAGAEPVVVERHVHHAARTQAIEQTLLLGVVVAFDVERHRRRESPLMSDRAVSATELAAGETERGDLDRALWPNVVRAVVVGGDQLEVVEHVAIQIERRLGDATLERQER